MAEFLAEHPPFDAVGDAELDQLARASQVHDFPAGAEIMNAFLRPAQALWVVMSGRVELWNTATGSAGGPDEVLDAGGVFGFSALLTGSSVGPRAVAAEPVRACRVPADVVQPLFASLAGAEFLARKLTVQAPGDGVPAVVGTVDELIRTVPAIGHPSMSVREAARIMTDRHRPYLVILDADGRIGLITDNDLRSRLVAAGLGPDTPVGQVMTLPARTVLAGTPAADALLEILEHGLSCLPVVDRAGQVRGVVYPGDFVAAPAGVSVSLREQISRAQSVDALVDRGSRVPYLLIDLLRRGRPSHEVTVILSIVTDALVRRGLDLVLAQHPELDGDAVTWLALGSNGRRETVLSSDIDSAVSFDESVPAERIGLYRAAFAEVEDILRRSGLSIDDHGATASKPLFARTHSQWGELARSWLDDPLRNKGMIMASLLVDARPIWGDPGLPAVSAVFRNLREHSGTMKSLLAESLSYRAKLRSMRDVFARRGDVIDIKAQAVLPVVNIARWVGLSVRTTEVGTRGRLLAAAGSPLLTETNARNLIEVFDVLQKIRISYQVAQLEAGERPSDVLDLNRLSPMDRSLIAQAVREISAVQKRMDNLSHYTDASEWAEGRR
ncbi:putative nucleotidyltransferase substrate binding domain-containing protein [Jongsikchunia kroppenstedtii]|uniref:putative nucleotidyltransferase substrate binding domain-containing protein n=1 Tax=Jongsikchunia kroppenstedtii TaxID=1121721 RepID=UPI00035EF39A|nr:putative nucleotidyltransferase substrate binding domain-containing protein [Jongsikchunia kroppenstedtii]